VGEAAQVEEDKDEDEDEDKDEGMVVVECCNMSCRVLHRGVELALLKRVASDAGMLTYADVC
jgi:predicted enzyme involved in methoxymalonyl-ACP biosynthesis